MTWTDLGSNPGLRSERPATDRLSQFGPPLTPFAHPYRTVNSPPHTAFLTKTSQRTVECDQPLLPAAAHNLESISDGRGVRCGTTQAFPAFLQVKELPGRSSDTLTQTRHGSCSWSGTQSEAPLPPSTHTHTHSS